jgi:GT2 family glycosyltransferase
MAVRPERDRIGSTTGKLVRADGPDLEPSEVLDAAGMLVTQSGRHFDRGAGEPDRGSYDQAAWVFGGTGAATLYRRAALDDVAYPNGEAFAESFFAYREDAELAWRLQWRGWRCLYEPTAVAAHGRKFRPEAGRSGHESINRNSVRNRFLLRLHCADLWWHLSCLPWWLLRDLIVVAACLTVERNSLGALAEAWRLRYDAWQRRRWVMDRRTMSSRQVRRWFRRTGWIEEISGN